MSRSFIKNLPKEVQIWIDKEIISNHQAKDILALYEKNPKNSYLLFAIIGSLFIGTGIISLIAHNWDEFSKTTRFIIGIFPLAVAQMLGFFTLKYRYKNQIWHEGVGIFWFLALGGGIAIIGQTYHLSSSLKDFYLLWILLIFPTLFLLKSDGVAFLVLALVNLLSLEARFASGSKILVLTFLGIWLIYYIYKMKNFKNSNAFTVLSWAFVFTITLNLGLLLNVSSFVSFYSYLFLFLGFYYVDLAFFDKLTLLKRPFSFVGKFGLSIIAILFLTQDGMDDMVFKVQNDMMIFNALCGVSFLLVSFLILRKKTDDIFYPLLPSLICILLHFPSLLWAYNIIFVLILAFMIYVNSIKGEMLSSNYSLGLLCVGIFMKFAINDFGFVVQGVAFILLGVCFLYLNLFIKKRVNR